MFMLLQAQPCSILDIHEILLTLIRYCDKPTLACLARTAKVLSGPALDVLWENLESFSHLLKVLPVSLVTWDQPEDGRGPAKPVIHHLIVPRDWKRFAFYAQRVRTWGPEDLSYIEEPLVDHIAFGRDPGYILPRLQHMEVTATNTPGIHLQTLLLCPTLESVSIWNSDPAWWATAEMKTFFRTLSDRATKLSKLIVRWGGGSAVTPQFMEDLADVFTSSNENADGRSELRSVNLWNPNCIDPHGFARLAQLPMLTTLHLNLIGNTHELFSEIANTSTAFSALENLFLAGETEGFYSVLRCFDNAPSMMSLGLSVRVYPKARDLTRLFNTVSSKFKSLRLLQFNVPKQETDLPLANSLYDETPEQYTHDMSVLQPLLSMRHLAAVHLELGVPLFLSDVDLCVLGSAWPAIEVLNLCSDPYCDRAGTVQPTSTIVGLLAITESCPSLQHLGLFLDCSYGITESMIASAMPVSRALINLDVGRSRVVEPVLVAALLSGVFPNLKVFQWAGMDGSTIESTSTSASVQAAALEEGYAPGWRQVFEMLPVFRAVRANERQQRNLSSNPNSNDEANTMKVVKVSMAHN